MKLRMTKPRNPKKKGSRPPQARERSSKLNAEEYRVKYLVGGNASHARLMRYARMLKQAV